MHERRVSVSLLELFVALSWTAVLLAAWFAFEPWISNFLMAGSTLAATSFVLHCIVFGSLRSKVFATGAVPCLFVALVNVPPVFDLLAMVVDRSITHVAEQETHVVKQWHPQSVNSFLRGSLGDTFPEYLPYCAYYRLSIITHLLAGVSGYLAILLTYWRTDILVEPRGEPKSR